MPIRVFKEHFGADIKSVMLQDMEDLVAASVAAGKLAATGLKTRNGATELLATHASPLAATADRLIHRPLLLPLLFEIMKNLYL